MKTSLKVVSINRRAIDDLRYIRETMESAGSFTAVSGWGGVLMGITAIAAAFTGSRIALREQWFYAWMLEALLAAVIGVLGAMWKAQPRNLLRGPGRKFLMSLLPSMAGGAILTGALYREGLFELMPGAWLLVYGVGVMSCGTYSVKVVPLMGAAFVALGAVALFAGWEAAQWCLAVGFGGLHVVFGGVIARRYGG